MENVYKKPKVWYPGAPLVRQRTDCDFTLTTTDDWRAAQFQHTVAITDFGVDILSL